jgi:hypothetical protein
MNRLVKCSYLIALLSLGAWLIPQLLSSDSAQVRTQQEKLLTLLESRSWLSVSSMLSAAYLDDWGQDSPTAQNAMRSVLSGFEQLEIHASDWQITTSPKQNNSPALAMIKVKLTVHGHGKGLSSTVIDESKRLKEPWTFHWRKEGAWPWSWRLMQIHHPTVSVPL